MLFVVNLDSATDRRQRMAAQLAHLGLAWERVGYDGRRVPHPAIAAFARAHFPPLEFDFASLSGAEIGCWISHLQAWRRLVTSATAPACAVLEDDLLLDASLPAALGDLATGHELDLVYLGTSSRNISTRQRVQVGGCTVHAPVGTVLNTWGYVVQRGYAQRFLATPRRIRLPIDRHLGRGRPHGGPRVGVLRPAAVHEDPALGVRSQIAPHTFRADRWRVVDAGRRWLLGSRMSDLYYAMYRWL